MLQTEIKKGILHIWIPLKELPSKKPIACGLTERQKLVVKLIRQGRSNKEIGNELNITERTVKWHVGELFRKTDARSRAAL